MSERPHSSTEDQASPVRQIGDLSGQVAVVTGSTSGIGLALARAVAAAGGDVVLNGLGDPAEIERTRADLEASSGRRVLYHPADMTQGDQIADMVAFAHRELGRLDILVNNAGIQHVESVENFPADQWEKIIAINLSSAFYATRAAIPDHEGAGARSDRQHGLGPWPGRQSVQVRLCRGQARDRRLHQDRGAGAGARQHHLQRHLPRLRRDAHRVETDRRPGPHPAT